MTRVMARIRKASSLQTSQPLQTIVPSVDVGLPESVDRVNNVVHKERALYEAGVTRRKVYENINLLLEASVSSREFDKDSREWHVVATPDLERRKQGSELALKAFGDLKEMVKVGDVVTHNKIVYQWLSAPGGKVEGKA